MLTVLEAVSAEHPGRNWRRSPLALLFVHYAALCARWNPDGKGFTYADRDHLEAFRARRKNKASHPPGGPPADPPRSTRRGIF